IGNILDTELEKLMASNKNFGFHKTYGLSNECLCCNYVKLCLGGCPKDRQGGRNYLCEGYRVFFANIVKCFS
ncbi:MAG: SPASM domain-containing protein, partial [Synergistaceae bacterium]|nr:SPASM domain-containing protein [Synergistaceae bacterium]